MVKVKNANVGREENYEERGSSRGGRTGKGKGKRVATEMRLPERFISVKEATNFEELTRKRIKIAPSHRIDLSDMEALHEHRRMNFGFMAIEHMLATQTSSTKCLPYGCSLTKVFQYFVLNLFVVGDRIGIGKIYIKHTFKRMGFSRNEEGMLVRRGQDEEEEEEEDEGQEAMDVDEEESEEEPEDKSFRREMRQKKRQERAEEGQSSGSMSQLMEMIAFMQASMNSCFDALDGKISNIQERVMRLEARGREEDK
ncbi:hypothetical protein M9H77_31247 [Catharanthus roseus]|uniref:Uncharacterized protein n=1 Tax=Catharanthus roseus TaxID=4058 RepID=A0ACC0A0L1_CATRO|nr:hypothetical protein M9H77_31247 [Catharanthus roseus]